MSVSLLVEYFNELPAFQDDSPVVSGPQFKSALEVFKNRVAGRYGEGTLQRLLQHPDVHARRAAILSLGLLGTMDSNGALAAMLHDSDRLTRQLTRDALWSLWFRADSEANNSELQRLVGLRDPSAKRRGLDALIRRAPGFAEVYNQRAILHYLQGDLEKSISDCEKVLKLNPHHFGAQTGMAQCYLKLGRPRAALKAFRGAYRLNPAQDVADAIRVIENALGEEGRKDERK